MWLLSKWCPEESLGVTITCRSSAGSTCRAHPFVLLPIRLLTRLATVRHQHASTAHVQILFHHTTLMTRGAKLGATLLDKRLQQPEVPAQHLALIDERVQDKVARPRGRVPMALVGPQPLHRGRPSVLTG